jgi:hypothetical protein
MRATMWAAFVAAMWGSYAAAQMPAPANCPPVPVCPPGVNTMPYNPDGTPNLTNPNAPVPELNPNVFAQGNEGGGTSARMFNDSFNGDFGGISCTCVGVVGPAQVNSLGVPVGPNARTLRLAAGSRYNGILNTDNDSPRPSTRVYFGYNYYEGINASYNGDLGGSILHRETVAFEYAFWDNTASVGLRLPFIQTVNAPLNSNQNTVGDLSVLLKYAFYNNRQTGDVLSAGLIVTTPTATGNTTLSDGSTLTLIDGTQLPTNSVLFQPWIGGVKMLESGYVQEITGLITSTSSREPTIFSTSLGAGYFLYKNDGDRLIRAVVPNVEAHVRIPLNNRDPNAAIFMQDQVNLSTGVHFRMPRATLSPAVNVPVVGPRPWNVEAAVWLNCYF